MMKIAVMPGDGIGPEVTAQAVKVLQGRAGPGPADGAGRGADRPGRHRQRRRSAARRRRCEIARKADAILFGVGRHARRRGRSRSPCGPGASLLRLRKELGLFANFRPAVLFPELIGASTLQARDRRRARPDDPARADRRHLLRRAARHRHRTPSGEREAFNTMRYTRARGRAHRARRLPHRARAPAQALLGGQGQRARDDAALARGGHARRHRSIRTSS